MLAPLFWELPSLRREHPVAYYILFGLRRTIHALFFHELVFNMSLFRSRYLYFYLKNKTSLYFKKML